jgi:hypothetical protein
MPLPTRLALALAALAVPVGAQRPATFVATRAQTINAATADFGHPFLMIVARNGELMVSDDNIIRAFSPAGSMTTFAREGEGPREFRRLTRIGLIADSVWALDPDLSRVTIFGPDHKFRRSFPLPHSIVSPKAPGDSAETVNEVYVQAMLPNGNLRAVASYRPTHRSGWTTGVDSGATLLVQATSAGVLVGRVAVIPRNACMVHVNRDGGGYWFSIPFCAAPVSTDWDGGALVAWATLEGRSGEQTTYRVTLVGATGAAMFARSQLFVPVPVTRQMIDSAAAALDKAATRLPRSIADAERKLVPAKQLPPVRRIVIGRDSTVWVEERLATPDHFWRVFDPHGAVVATLVLPPAVSLQLADRQHVWAYESDADDVQGVVRFRLSRKP